jgi:hypothetical protein
MCFKRMFTESRVDFAFKWVGGILGAMMVVIALTLITFGTFAYLRLVLPFVLGVDVTPLRYAAHRVITSFFAVQAIFNYLACVLTKPGSPSVPAGTKYFPVERSERESYFDDGTLWRHCKKCDNVKPPRSHHCNVCQQCVLNMDHHCPWYFLCESTTLTQKIDILLFPG